MLEAMRTKAGSWIVKLLFAFLILSFGVWGIGDIFNRVTAPDTQVATVDGVKITPQQLNVQFRRDLARLRAALGAEIDAEQARELGMMERSLEQLIEGQLLAREAQRLGILVSDDEIRRRIAEEPAFKNQLGLFDPRVYDMVLSSNGMNEAMFVASLREQIVRGRIAGALGAGADPPKPLVAAIYAYRYEKRVAEFVRIPREGAGEVGQPDEAALADFHQKHPDMFSAPEKRDITVVYIDPNELTAGIKPPEDRIEEEFERRKQQLTRPEKRKLAQLVARDEATARRAYDAVKSGTPFADVARDVTRQAPETLDLGTVTRGELTRELAEAAFKLPEDGASEPVRSPLGWHIVKVEKIEPGHTATLAEVKDQLANDIARELAADEAIRVSNRFEDRLAGGADLETAAQTVNARVIKAAGIDTEGHGLDRLPEALAKDRRFLQLAFNSAQGTQSTLGESAEGGYYVVRVDAVTPRTVRPLAEMKDEVAAAWRRAQLDELARKKAEAIVERVRSGTPLKDAAAALGLKSETSRPFTRIALGAQSAVPEGLAAGLFRLKQGGAEMAPFQDGYAVGQVLEIIPANIEADKSGAEEIAQELRGSIAGDVLAEFTSALRERFPVTINAKALEDTTEARQPGQPLPARRR